MNIVRELRIKKGIQAKQLAMEIGVSNATVSDWEHGRKNPTGERLKKLAEYFAVDEGFILGYGLEKPSTFVPDSQNGISQTEQIVKYVLDKMHIQTDQQSDNIKTPEAKILARGIDKLPKDQREQALNVVKAMFAQYADLFDKGEEANDT